MAMPHSRTSADKAGSVPLARGENRMARHWTLKQTIDWLWAACAERYLANPADPGWRISFHQSPSPDTPPDGLILRAFRVLESQKLVTGHVIDADNTDALCIRDLQVSDQGILQIEATADAKPDAPWDSIHETGVWSCTATSHLQRDAGVASCFLDIRRAADCLFVA